MKKLLFIFNFRTFCHFCALQAQSVAGSLKQSYLYCLLMMAMFLPQVVSAAVVYWTGTTNSDWNTASNWTTGILPTSADDVYIHAGSTPDPVISSGTITVRSVQVRVRSLTVNSGATLRIIGDAGSAFAIFMMTDASSVINNGTIALEASTGGPTTGWMIPSATTTFTNNGTLRINTTFQTAIEAGHNLNNEGQATGLCTINNSACGKIILTAGNFMIYASTVSNVTNAGLIQVTANINGVGNFTNQSGGVLIRGGGSQAITSNNGSVIVNNNPTNSTIFTYTGTFTGTLNGIYTDSAGTTSAGTFTAPNTFSPSGLPTGAQTLYAKITPSGGACSYVVPFTYTMIAAPSITTQPTSGSTCAGSSRTFTVAASNAPTYQWQVSTGGSFTNLSNTSPYSNVTGASLNISNVAGLNGYQYRCIATNGGGSDTSNAAILTVNTAPAITTQPTAQTTCAGSSVSFSVAATGTSLSYQWKKGTTNVGTNSATYTIASPVVGDAGNYSVVVSGTCGSPETSNSVALTVNPFALRAYVNGAVASSGDGTSWATAVKTIEEGLNICGAEEVWVATGTYKPTKDPFGNTNPTDPRDKTFYIKDGIEIYGGFAGTETLLSQRNITANTTTLSGDFNDDDVVTGSGSSLTITGNGENAYHVVLASTTVSGAGVTIDGFSIIGGHANGSGLVSVNGNNIYRFHGGGILAYRGTNTLTNNILSGNSANSYPNDAGGGICAFYGTNTITNNILSRNRASYFGGGICAFYGTNTITDNNLSGNRANTNGGGIGTFIGSNNTLANNTLSGNSAGYGGGIYANNSTNTLTNNTLLGNSASEGGGIYIDISTNTLTNNTLSGNSSGNGGGIYIGSGTNTLTNNTLSGNSSGNGGGIYIGNGTNTLTNNTLSGNWAGNGGGVYTNATNGTNAFINNIFWGNKKGTNVNILAADYFATNTNGNIFTNNLLQLATSNYPTDASLPYGIGTAASGNIFATDPLFVNAADIDGADDIHRTADDGLRLSTCSPAINVGTNTNAPTTDILGNAIYNSLKDMGAYELQANPSIVPAITTQPTAQTICAGSSVSFSVAATGTGLSYQWKKGATNVGTNSATYTIPSPVVGDTGNYSVVVSGTCGSPITSNSVALTVNTAPSITTQPTAQTTCAGSSVSFSVAATGTGLSYQWKKGATNVGTNSATYTIASPVVGDAGNYSVVVSGTCGSPVTSNSVALTINTAINITTQPTAQTTCVGSSVSFSVAATGAGLSYQWKKGMTNVGTNSATYTIASPVVGDTGNYNVVVSGTCGSPITSNSVALTVNTAPSITTEPTAQTTCAGSSVSFSVAATGTGLSYQWKKGATNVGTNSATYTIPSPVVGDTGNYSVVVSGTCGSPETSNSVALMVNPFALRAYVNGAVASSGDGTSWATAVKTIEEGLNICGAEEVWVATGTYKPTKDPFGNASPSNPRDKTFYIKDGIEIYGGFAGTETLLSQRNITANITTLSGDFNGDDVVTGSGSTLSITNNTENAYYVVLASAPTSGGLGVTIDGFTIRGGNANGSSNLTVNGNSISRSNGGGIHTYNGTNTLTNNTLSGNSANTYGGGFYIRNGTNTLTNNTLSGNSAHYGGGIVVYNGTNNTLTNNTLLGNSADLEGGGFYIRNGTNTLTNNTLSGNSANYGGGIYTDGGTNNYATLTNNTLSGNSATLYGGGIYTYDGTNTINNCIFWANTQGGNAAIAGSDILNSTANPATNTVTYCLTQLNSTYSTGTGIINNQNPLFVNAADIDGADNIHRTADDGLLLSTCSPAINVGTNTNAPTTDILGNAIYSSLKDMGAYELQANPSIAPAITTQPTAQTVCAGSSVSFSVATTGTGLSYQWKKGATNVGTNSATYTIASPVVADTGSYSVVVSGTCGSPVTSNSVALTVNTAPSITTQPTAQTTCVGSSVSFSVAATGTGLSYQWKKGTTNVGTNSATYTIASPVVGDTGNYNVVVSGTCGSPITSNSVALTVNTAPSITTQPTAQTTCAGSSVSFSVAATGTGLSYQWKKGSTNVGTNSATYTIASPVVGDAGNYSVVVSGTCGSPVTSNSVALTVNTAPAITTQPTAQITCAGSSVSFSVAATGTGLSYQWKKGSTNVGTNSATYTIASPVVGDAGNYSVVVSGTCGSPITSNSVALTVNTAPAITTQPTAQITCAGSSVSFSVAATGTGLSYQWKKGTTNVGTNSATYTIASPVVGDAGNYSVVVSGTCAPSLTSNIVLLNVNPVPNASITYPTTLCTSASATNVQLSGSNTGTYSASPAGLNIDTNTGTIMPSSSALGVYTITYAIPANGNCASFTTTTTVNIATVPPAPSISASSNNVCAGTPVTLTASPATGYSSVEYLWYKNGIPVYSQNGGNGTYIVNAGTSAQINQYAVQVVYSGSTCLSNTSSPATVTTSAPAATITPTGPTIFCANNPTLLSAPTGMSSYIWKRGTATVSVGAATYTPTVSGNHRVTVTDANGCSKTSAWTNITVNAIPVANAGADKNLCTGNVVQIGIASSVGNTYTWSPNVNLSNAYIANPLASPLSTTTYTLTVTNNTTGCSKTDAVLVTVNPLPFTPSISRTTVGTNAILVVNSPGANAVNWYKNGLLHLSNQPSNGSITVPITNTIHDYTCKSIGLNGCLSSFSNFINARNGDEKEGDLLTEIDNNIMTVYPNPTNGNLHIEISHAEATSGTLYLYNAVGQQVFSQNINLLHGSADEILDLQNLAAGVYTLTFQTENSNSVQKVVKD